MKSKNITFTVPTLNFKWLDGIKKNVDTLPILNAQISLRIINNCSLGKLLLFFKINRRSK